MRIHTLKENIFILHSMQLSIANSSLSSTETLHSPPLSMREFCQPWPCVGLGYAVSITMSSYVQLPCTVFASSSSMISVPCMRGAGVIRMSHEGWVFHNLLSSVYVSVLIVNYWWGSKYALFYEYNVVTRSPFNIISIQLNRNSSFSPRSYDPSICRLLALTMVPGVDFILWSRP